MSEYDAAFVFMPIAEAQAYFNRAGDVTAIEVYTNNPDRVMRFRKLLTEAAGRPIFMIDWTQRNATFFNALQVERNVMFLILTLIVLVAALNIVSGLIMLVKDKSSDIAILRTMGAIAGLGDAHVLHHRRVDRRGRHARRLPAGRRGVLEHRDRSGSSFPGSPTGRLFSPELYFLSRLPAEMDVRETTAVVVMSLTLSVAATLYPSFRAARLDPVEALRYE